MISSLTGLITHYGLIGMFLLVATENMGIPLPTEPAYIVGQIRLDNGSSPYWLVLLVLFAGHMAGSTVSYLTGRRLVKTMQNKQDLTDVQHKLAHWYAKYGNVTVFSTRLIGHVRPWSSYIAGIAEVKPLPFFALTTLGALIFNILSLLVTRKIIYFWAHYPILRLLISLSFSVGFLFLLWEIIKKNRSRKMDAISSESK